MKPTNDRGPIAVNAKNAISIFFPPDYHMHIYVILRMTGRGQTLIVLVGEASAIIERAALTGASICNRYDSRDIGGNIKSLFSRQKYKKHKSYHRCGAKYRYGHNQNINHKFLLLFVRVTRRSLWFEGQSLHDVNQLSHI